MLCNRTVYGALPHSQIIWISESKGRSSLSHYYALKFIHRIFASHPGYLELCSFAILSPQRGAAHQGTHPLAPGKEPVSKALRLTVQRRRKTWPMCLRRIQARDSLSTGLASGKYILGSTGRVSILSLYKKRENSHLYWFYLFAHLNRKKSHGFKVCRSGQILSRPLRHLKMQIKRKTFLPPCLHKLYHRTKIDQDCCLIQN